MLQACKASILSEHHTLQPTLIFSCGQGQQCICSGRHCCQFLNLTLQRAAVRWFHPVEPGWTFFEAGQTLNNPVK